MVEDIVLVPSERIGVIIGKNGKVKKEIEKRLGVKIRVEPEDNEVIIERDESNPEGLKAREVIKAIARGFSPEKAFKLFYDDYYLEVITITDFVSKGSLERIRGRLIGRKGKARRKIEELTNTYISIYGKTVSIIGDIEGLRDAKEAILGLIQGKQHNTVFRALERKKREEFIYHLK